MIGLFIEEIRFRNRKHSNPVLVIITSHSTKVFFNTIHVFSSYHTIKLEETEDNTHVSISTFPQLWDRKITDSSTDNSDGYKGFVRILCDIGILTNRNKKSAGIEELLGLNVRADRIVVNPIDSKKETKKDTPLAVEWSTYTVYFF